MTFLFFVLLVLTCSAMVAWGLQQRGRVYEYPFLAGVVFGGWVLPQAVGLLRDEALPSGGLAKTLLMTVLCAAMLSLGYAWRRREWRVLAWEFDKGRLLQGAVVLSIIGAYFTYLIRNLPEDMLTGVWTGLPVRYLFFAHLQIYGFAIAALLFARTGSRIALAIAVFDLAFFLDPILVAARRAFAVEVALIILLAFWFGRGWALPRGAMVALVVLGLLLTFSIGHYRALTYRGGLYGGRTGRFPTWEDVKSIDYGENLSAILTRGGPELRNAVYDIAATQELSSFNFGLSYWNRLMFTYVPAQLFGEELKASVMFHEDDAAWKVYAYTARFGSTHTGMADSFQALWYVGAMMFFAIAWIMRSLYDMSRDGQVVAQLAYVLIITDAVRAITHDTSGFFMPWVHMSVFILPVIFWARIRYPEAHLAPGTNQKSTRCFTGLL